MSSELSVRRLAPHELDVLLALYRELHPQDDPGPPRHALEALWRSICADPMLVYMGGFRDGALVSTCNAALVPNLTRGARPYAVIENVVTRAADRRRGYAAAVMRALIEHCKAANCYKIMLMSAVTRAEQHAFYDALGFDRRAKQAFVLDLRKNL